jgi:hypothetical protein
MLSETEKILNQEYDKLSPEEKFNMMLSMCKTVRTIITSRLPDGLSEAERRLKIFEIYYKQDFSEEEFKKIVAGIFKDTTPENPGE